MKERHHFSLCDLIAWLITTLGSHLPPSLLFQSIMFVSRSHSPSQKLHLMLLLSSSKDLFFLGSLVCLVLQLTLRTVLNFFFFAMISMCSSASSWPWQQQQLWLIHDKFDTPLLCVQQKTDAVLTAPLLSPYFIPACVAVGTSPGTCCESVVWNENLIANRWHPEIRPSRLLSEFVDGIGGFPLVCVVNEEVQWAVMNSDYYGAARHSVWFRVQIWHRALLIQSDCALILCRLVDQQGWKRFPAFLLTLYLWRLHSL